MTTAREIMTKDVEWVKFDATAAEAAKLMAKHDIGSIPVCTGDGKLKGMVTDRDLAVTVMAKGMDPTTTKLSEIVGKTEVVTIGADDSIKEALRTMKDKKVRRLPVIDGTEMVGIISQGDIATNMPDDMVGDLVEAISAAP